VSRRSERDRKPRKVPVQNFNQHRFPGKDSAAKVNTRTAPPVAYPAEQIYTTWGWLSAISLPIHPINSSSKYLSSRDACSSGQVGFDGKSCAGDSVLAPTGTQQHKTGPDCYIHLFIQRWHKARRLIIAALVDYLRCIPI